MSDQNASDQPRTRTGEVIREAKGLAKFLAFLEPKHAQTLALILFSVGSLALIGYREIGRDQVEKERQAQMMRTFAEMTESIQQHDQNEREKDRGGAMLLYKDVLAHSTAQAERDRQERKEFRTEWKSVQNAWAAFAIRFGDFERLLKMISQKLGMQLPEFGGNDIEVAPMPKCLPLSAG